MEIEDNYDFILEIFKKSYKLCSPVGDGRIANPSISKVFDFLLKTTLSFNSDLDKSSFELNWSKFKNFIFNNFTHFNQANNFKDEWSRTILQIEEILGDTRFENYPRGNGFPKFYEKDFPLLLKEAEKEKINWARINIAKDIDVEMAHFSPKGKSENVLLGDSGTELGGNNQNFQM